MLVGGQRLIVESRMEEMWEEADALAKSILSTNSEEKK